MPPENITPEEASDWFFQASDEQINNYLKSQGICPEQARKWAKDAEKDIPELEKQISKIDVPKIEKPDFRELLKKGLQNPKF